MSDKTELERSILLFVALAALISSIFYAPIILQHKLAGGGGAYVRGLMWSPTIAALLTVLIRKLDFKSLGFNWEARGARYALIGYLTPLAYATVAYLLVWGLGLGGFPDPAAVAKIAERMGWTIPNQAAFLALYFIVNGTIGMVGSTASALGEEIGWRGFLAPRMAERFGFLGGSLLTGVVWTAWHMPILLFADYNNGTPWWFGLSCFAVMVLSLSVMLTWLRLRSGSVWPCAILHASHNLFIQSFFTPLTSAKGDVTKYMIDEFGLLVPSITVLFAVGFWMLQRRASRTGASDPAAQPA